LASVHFPNQAVTGQLQAERRNTSCDKERIGRRELRKDSNTAVSGKNKATAASVPKEPIVTARKRLPGLDRLKPN
jgi:hypothetical protein